MTYRIYARIQGLDQPLFCFTWSGPVAAGFARVYRDAAKFNIPRKYISNLRARRVL